MTRTLVPIPADRIESHVGKMVHVRGWAVGCVFRLAGLDLPTGTARLITPKTGRRYTVPFSKLAYTRADEPEDCR